MTKVYISDLTVQIKTCIINKTGQNIAQWFSDDPCH